MRITDRDRRAVILLAVVGVPVLGWYFLSSDEVPKTVAASIDSIPAAEKRLAKVRQLAAAVPGKEQALASVQAELETREKGLVQADSAAQAQAQLLQIIRRIAKAQEMPIDIRTNEMGQVKAFGDKYGEVAVSVSFEAGIEQLLNFLSGLTAQKELIGTTDLRIAAANPKLKTMPVRLTVSALVRRELIPEKKGPAF